MADPKKLTPANRRKEYLSGGSNRSLSPLLRDAVEVLSRLNDEITREFSDRAYEEMLRDPAVSASVDTLKSLILLEPLRVVPRIADKKDPNYEEARRIADFVERNLRGMARPTHAILWESLDALVYGSALVELVFEDATEEGRPILRLRDLKTRSRATYGLVVDRYFNLLGAISTEAGQGPGIFTGMVNPDPAAIIPRQKFWMLTPFSRNSDPRGVSLLAPAWNPHYLKTQTWPSFLKWLVQFASPSIVGFTPEGAEDVEVYDESGNPVFNEDGTVKTITAEEDMLETLLGFQSGTVAVLRGGSSVDLIKSDGQGRAFSESIDLYDRQIAMAILKTHRTLLEAKHSSKADSESAADITDVFVSSLREVVAATFSRDVVRTLVEVNFGPETAETLAPTATLKAMPKQDFAAAAGAISKLFSVDYLHDSQIGEIDAMVGLPERNLDAWLAERAEAEEIRRSDEIERLKLANPGAGTTPPKEEPDPEDD